MGELRLYAVGLEEVRGISGAREDKAAHLREIAAKTFAPAVDESRTGLLAKLGPIFRRPPTVQVISPTQPEPHDLEVLLAGAYVPPERAGATWRLLEAIVADLSWGSTRLALTSQSLDDLDFALARGGVSSAVGLRHLLGSTASLNVLPVTGLAVGWHPYVTALAMASSYRAASREIATVDQQEMVNALAGWLDGFVAWAQVAPSLGRPAPDLLGFYAV